MRGSFRRGRKNSLKSCKLNGKKKPYAGCEVHSADLEAEKILLMFLKLNEEPFAGCKAHSAEAEEFSYEFWSVF